MLVQKSHPIIYFINCSLLTMFVHKRETLEYLEHYIPNRIILKIPVPEDVVHYTAMEDGSNSQ